MLPVVLRPQLLSIKNRWRQRKSIGREIVVFTLSAFLIRIIYTSSSTFLSKCEEHGFSSFQTFELLLNPALVLSFIVLFCASVLHSFTSFFRSDDMEILLASPVSPLATFIGKYIEVIFSSLWMIIVFTIPFLCALIPTTDNPLLYLSVLLVSSLSILILASASGLLSVLVGMRIFSLNGDSQRITTFILLVVVSLFAFLSHASLTPEKVNLKDSVQMISQIGAISSSFYPVSLISEMVIGITLDLNYYSLAYAGLSIFIITSILTTSFFVFKYTHFDTYSKMISNQLKPFSKCYGIKILNIKRNGRPFSGIAWKEFKCFTRDLVHTFQLTLLTAICLIYIYNFQSMQAYADASDTNSNSLMQLLFISNLAMGAFVITALSTRFVYPSISLEGKSLWIIRSSPIPIKSFVLKKFWTWYIPVSFIACTILVSGTFALDCTPEIIILTAIGSFVLTYGIIGLAIGFGARYANFEWEHSSQICASVGSMFYMLTSTFFIMINIIILCFIIWIRIYTEQIDYLSIRAATLTAISAFIFVMFNYIIANIAINHGAKHLDNYH